MLCRFFHNNAITENGRSDVELPSNLDLIDKGRNMKALIKRGVKNFCGIVYLIVVGAMLLAGCKDNATNPFSSRDYLLCYLRLRSN